MLLLFGNSSCYSVYVQADHGADLNTNAIIIIPPGRTKTQGSVHSINISSIPPDRTTAEVYVHPDSKEKIATNILADRLSMLESYAFVTKKMATDKKSKFVYYPSEKSIALLPILLEIGAWGSQFRSTPDVMALVKAFKKDRATTIRQLQKKLRSKIKAFAKGS